MQWLRDHRFGLWAFTAMVAYWPGILSAPFVPRWCVIAIGAPLLASIDPRRLYQPVLWLSLWGIALAALSLRMSPDPRAGSLELIYMVMLFGVFVAGSAIESLDDAMTGAALGLGVSSLVCIAQYVAWEYMAWHILPTTGAAGGAGESGLFLNNDVLGVTAAPVLVWALIARRWALAVLVLPAIALCESRGALLAVAAGLIYAWRPRLAVVALIAACAVIAAVVVFFTMDPHSGRAVSADHRLVIWGTTIMNFTLAGKGLGWFQAALPLEGYAHSDVLQAIAELGPGALALAAIPWMILRLKDRGTNAELSLFVVLCAECAIAFPLHLPASGFLAALAAGYLARARVPLRVVGHERRVDNGLGILWRFPAYHAAHDECGPGGREVST